MKSALPDGSEAGAALASLAPLLFVALWSTGFIGAKLGLPYVEPLTFLALRFAIVIVLMSAVAMLVRAPWPPLGMRWVHIGVSGLLVHGVYLGGVFTAIAHGLPSGTTALVVGLQPILTALAAGTLLGERVRPAQWMGLVLGFAGGRIARIEFSHKGDHLRRADVERSDHLRHVPSPFASTASTRPWATG